MTRSISDSERQRIAETRANNLAPNTRKLNKMHWRDFTNWLKKKGFPLLLPVHPELVALHLVDMSEAKYSYSSISNATKGISHEHKQGGHVSPTTSVVVKEVMAGLYRDLGGRQHQVRPLLAADIAAVRRTACLPRPSNRVTQSRDGYETSRVAERRGRLDIAIICTMFDGLFRIGEAAELRWNDIFHAKDGSGIALIRFSKTDQEGDGAYVWLSPDTMDALDAIRPVTPDDEALVFGLGEDPIRKRIKKMAMFAGLGDGYSGHSPRVGMIYELVMADIKPSAIIQAARWKDSTMLAHYTRHIQATRGAVAQLYSGKSPSKRRFRIRRPEIAVRYIERAA